MVKLGPFLFSAVLKPNHQVNVPSFSLRTAQNTGRPTRRSTSFGKSRCVFIRKHLNHAIVATSPRNRGLCCFRLNVARTYPSDQEPADTMGLLVANVVTIACRCLLREGFWLDLYLCETSEAGPLAWDQSSVMWESPTATCHLGRRRMSSPVQTISEQVSHRTIGWLGSITSRTRLLNLSR